MFIVLILTGRKKQGRGKAGKSVYIHVPPGTVVRKIEKRVARVIGTGDPKLDAMVASFGGNELDKELEDILKREQQMEEAGERNKKAAAEMARWELEGKNWSEREVEERMKEINEKYYDSASERRGSGEDIQVIEEGMVEVDLSDIDDIDDIDDGDVLEEVHKLEELEKEFEDADEMGDEEERSMREWEEASSVGIKRNSSSQTVDRLTELKAGRENENGESEEEEEDEELWVMDENEEGAYSPAGQSSVNIESQQVIRNLRLSPYDKAAEMRMTEEEGEEEEGEEESGRSVTEYELEMFETKRQRKKRLMEERHRREEEERVSKADDYWDGNDVEDYFRGKSILEEGQISPKEIFDVSRVVKKMLHGSKKTQ